jgi:hypothetical protein
MTPRTSSREILATEAADASAPGAPPYEPPATPRNAQRMTTADVCSPAAPEAPSSSPVSEAAASVEAHESGATYTPRMAASAEPGAAHPDLRPPPLMAAAALPHAAAPPSVRPDEVQVGVRVGALAAYHKCLSVLALTEPASPAADPKDHEAGHARVSDTGDGFRRRWAPGAQVVARESPSIPSPVAVAEALRREMGTPPLMAPAVDAAHAAEPKLSRCYEAVRAARARHDITMHALLDAWHSSAAEEEHGSHSGSVSRPTAAHGAESGIAVAGAWQGQGCGEEREREYSMLEQQVRRALPVALRLQCELFPSAWAAC